MKDRRLVALIILFIITVLCNPCEAQNIKVIQWKTLTGHSDWVKSIAFSPDGELLASASDDNKIKLWSVETGMNIKTIRTFSNVLSVSFSPDGKLLASGSNDDLVTLWSVETGNEIRTFRGHSGDVLSVSFSPDGKILASGGDDNNIKLWSVRTGQEIKTLDKDSGMGKIVAFSPDGKFLAFGGRWDDTIQLWSVDMGLQIKRFRGHALTIYSLSFSPDGKLLASGSLDNTIKLWSVETGKEVKTLQGHSDYIRSVSFSPDGKLLVSGSKDKTIKIWSVQTGRELKKLHDHSGLVSSVCFSPDGNLLASGSWDKTVRLWKIEGVGTPVLSKLTYQPSYSTDLTKPQSNRPLYPADLFIENVQFLEPSGNNALDGYESGKIQFTLTNKGRGEAQNIQVSLSPLTTAEGLTYTPTQIIERANAKSSVPVAFTISAAGKVTSLPRTFRIQAAEEFGFDADPVRISFETKAFEAPDMRIEKIAINDREEGDAYGNGNSIIEPNESIVVTAYVQNFGAGPAEQVKATLRLEGSDPNLQCPDNGKVIDLATIAPGDYKPVSFYFFTSKRFSGTNLPIKIALTESKGDYGKTIDLGLKMNVRTANIVDVNITRIERPKPEIKVIAEAAKSDVDVILQKSKNNEPEDFAVIIGVENYKYAPKVTYAERDAGAFYNYAVQVLGIPERNIYYLVNEGATSGEFKKLFEKDGWIAKRATPNSDIFVYYSGHGAPNLKDKSPSPYIIPYDIDPNYASTGFALNSMYETLGGLNAKSITIILDACFSGQSREKEMLLAQARPIFIKVEGPQAYEKLTVFSAASGAEISSGYPEQRHGIFSYFLLKGLQGTADANADKKITVGELFNYLKPNVTRAAASLDREQTPSLVTKELDRVLAAY